MLVLEAPESLGVVEAASATGLHKATVSRILASLAADSYVSKDPRTGRYVAGVSTLRRLRTSRLEDLLWAQGQVLLTHLRDISGETVSLHVVAWPERVCIGEIPGLHGLRRAHAPGEAWPLTTGATGLAFLAASTDQVVAQALAARPIEASTRATFKERLGHARAHHVAVADQPDHISGMVGMSAAILKPNAVPLAMVTVSGPAVRFSATRMMDLLPALRETADEMGRLIGG